MCCGHLYGTSDDMGPNIPKEGSLLERIDEDRCVCCGSAIVHLMRKEYIAERVWVCHGYRNDTPTCCWTDGVTTGHSAIVDYGDHQRVDHAVSHRDAILAQLDKEMREKMLA